MSTIIEGMGDALNNNQFKATFDSSRCNGTEFGPLKVAENQDYYGCLSLDGQPNGYGQMVTPLGTYTGEFQNGKRSGQGSFKDAMSKTNYIGTWSGEDEQLNDGEAIIEYADYKVYIGPVKDGKREGQGKLEGPGGPSWLYLYEGSFVNDQFSGTGSLTDTDGSLYKGPFSFNERSGWGETTYLDGSKHMGLYAKDSQNGFGVSRKVESIIDGKTTWGDLFTGDFTNGAPNYANGVGIVNNSLKTDGLNTMLLHASIFQTLADAEVIFLTLDLPKGVLDKETFHAEMVKNGSKLKKQETDAVFNWADRDNNGELSSTEFDSYILPINTNNFSQVTDIALYWLDFAGFELQLTGSWFVSNGVRSQAQWSDSLLPFFGDVNSDGKVTQEEYNAYFTCFAAHVDDDEAPIKDIIKVMFNKDIEVKEEE